MTNLNLFQTIAIIKSGGWAMLPIILMAIFSIILIIDKLLFFYRNASMPKEIEDLLNTEFNTKKLRSLVVSGVINNKNLYGNFIVSTLKTVDNLNNININSLDRDSNYNNKKLVEARVVANAQRLEKIYSSSLWIIDTFVTLAPLIGLFGTIIGMMDSFKIIGTGKIDNPNAITAGVAEALIATASGLVVAIFDLFFLNFLNRNQAIFLSNLEVIGNLIIEQDLKIKNQ